MRRTKAQKAEQQDAIRQLANLLWDASGKPRQIHATVTHVAASGMSRVINFVVFRAYPDPARADGLRIEPFYLSRLIALALGWPLDHKREGVRVAGCGMDMAFHTLDSVAHVVSAEMCPDLSYEARRKAFPMPDYRSL